MIRTERLLLRRWTDDDREPFAALNADLAVMEHFPPPLSRKESHALVDRIETGFEERNWGLWALEAPEGFIGFTGLSVPTFEADFLPAVEVGWRPSLVRRGARATPARRLRRRCGTPSKRSGLRKSSASPARTNLPSARVMQRSGMVPAGEFEHPVLPEGHRLRPHVLDQHDPNAQFLGEESQGGLGNHAGLEMALHRLVRWLMTRRRDSR